MSAAGNIAMAVLRALSSISHVEITDPQAYLAKAQKHNARHPFHKLKDQRAFYEYEEINGCHLIIIRSKKESRKDKAILYLHGGITNDWEAEIMVARSYADHTGMTVWYPVYPTVSEAPASDILSIILSVYQKMIRKYKADHIAWIGTSFGGTFGFGLITKINREYPDLAMPALFIANSPGGVPQTKKDWAIMKTMSEYDPLIDLSAVKNIMSVQQLFRDDIPAYAHSPMYGDFRKVPETYIYYALETLAGNYQAYVSGYEKYDVSDQMHMHIEPGMMHGYSCLPIFKESRKAYDEQLSLLQKIGGK